tara:strand:- start:375 stop:632 length:258 start_codon:yes stop_codon:yes gene_type:complete
VFGRKLMKVRVSIVLKKTVLDPQGQAIAMSLKNQGFSQVESVRQGKIIDLELNEKFSKSSKKTIEKICEDLLINPQIETYSIQEV